MQHDSSNAASPLVPSCLLLLVLFWATITTITSTQQAWQYPGVWARVLISPLLVLLPLSSVLCLAILYRQELLSSQLYKL